MNIGAVLVVEATSDLDFVTVSSTLAERIPRVRRLRQRLQGTPPGCGRPVWVDQPDFDLGRHLSETVLPTAPGSAGAGRFDEQVLAVAADWCAHPCPDTSRSGPPGG
ncbi:wax ester/triacylglycerol synthase domain-containing protein [Calidifontibacter indicus]|uniref:wax ester/triacylglycerol synthase domain-containing protein n=1 Tax=Calidifontibacter indicus TaxID=419650 RepID=UPI003CCC4B4B